MRSIGLLLLVSAVAFAQRTGTGHSATAYPTNGLGLIRGTGNVVYPGTGHPPGVVNKTAPPSGRHPGGAARRGTGAVIYVPYGVSSYYEPVDPGSGYYPQQPQQQMAPQVVINQNFVSETARPVVREYVSDENGAIRLYQPPAEQAPQVEENPTYLIAFKDHTIYAALAYWVEEGTLHYVTNQNTHNQVSLDLVDRELSERLNRERSVDFRLPPRR